MSSDTKRPRGRPKGSGKDDSKDLYRIADLLVADPSLKPTTAIKRIGRHNPSDIRRLQVKWKATRDDLLAAANKRKVDAERERLVPAEYGAFPDLGEHLAYVEQLRRAMEGPTAQFAEQQRRLEEIFRPALKIVEQMEKQQRMFREALGPVAEVHRMLEQLDPLRRWNR